MVKPGTIVSGTVELVTPDAIVVNVNNGQSHLKGTVPTQHLSDHRGIPLTLACLMIAHFDFFRRCNGLLHSDDFFLFADTFCYTCLHLDVA